MTEVFRTPYDGYDVTGKRTTPSWDDITREAVRRRLEEVPARRFLDPDEYAILEAACARIIPQPDRNEPVPIAPWIDLKLHLNRTDGYRYEDMPPLRETWQRGLNGLDEEARARFETGFTTLPDRSKDKVLSCLQNAETKAVTWQKLSASRFFNDHLLADCITIYYAHPEAWNEIGFGGPASPRGYARLGAGMRDPWEAPPATGSGDANGK